MIEENYKDVLENIRIACEKSNRNFDDVCLITVSKTKPVSDLKEAYNAGSRDFGENKVQELCDKIEKLPDNIFWHMIGHLQRNKVKYIIGKTKLIHSVDSLRLAKEISKESAEKNLVTDILIEVNVAKEDTKYGVLVEDTEDLIRQISVLPGIKIQGLMTIAPFVQNPEENREFFHELKKLSIDIINKHIDNVTMSILSMGMTNDYMVAVEEGATHVRVGTGIFGKRDYNIE